MIRVGINGFGRIGRCVARHILDERNDLEIIKINATGDYDSNRHLLHLSLIHI